MHNADADPLVFDDDFIEYQRALRSEALVRDELLFFETQFPGTPVGVRAALLRRLPFVKQVSFTMTKPFAADVVLELPAWAWLTLGLLQLLVWRRARRVLRREAPKYVTTRVRIVVKRDVTPSLAPAAHHRGAERAA
jgi:hypothetical protein